jgi:hypothetical protein
MKKTLLAIALMFVVSYTQADCEIGQWNWQRDMFDQIEVMGEFSCSESYFIEFRLYDEYGNLLATAPSIAEGYSFTATFTNEKVYAYKGSKISIKYSMRKASFQPKLKTGTLNN